MTRKPKGPPAVLGVLGQPYAIKVVPGLESYGLCEWDSRTISIADHMLPFDLKDTVLHEVMHAIRHAQGREYGGPVEEDYVRSLATGLTMVLQQNPEFAKWLIRP